MPVMPRAALGICPEARPLGLAGIAAFLKQAGEAA